MNRCILLAAAACLPLTASAVTLNINAQDLAQGSVGNPMPVNGLVILVASTSNSSFDALTPTSIVNQGFALNPGSDDVVVAEWALGSAGAFAGSFNGALASVSGQWTENDRLRLYWFPTLTTADSAAGAGTAYNFFPDHDLAEPDSGTWVTPSDSSISPLVFLTDNYPTGNHPQSRGVASLTVVPEPSFYASVAAAGCLAWAAVKRRRRARRG